MTACEVSQLQLRQKHFNAMQSNLKRATRLTGERSRHALASNPTLLTLNRRQDNTSRSAQIMDCARNTAYFCTAGKILSRTTGQVSSGWPWIASTLSRTPQTSTSAVLELASRFAPSGSLRTCAACRQHQSNFNNQDKLRRKQS
jgi:hypothetical protein